MAVPKKLFSIERKRVGVSARPSKGDLGGHAEDPATLADITRVMDAIDALNDRLVAMGPDVLTVAEQEAKLSQSSKIDMIENQIAEISGRISATKAEIAALRHPLSDDDKFESATLELSAIVQQTETATEKIMESAERIEEATGELMSRKLNEYDNAVVGEIVDEVTRVYEACNFQDLTGQRITKVVRVLNFIEERVDSMMNAWDIREFETMPLPAGVVQKDGDLDLHGPADNDDDPAITQDEIDKLFD